MRKKKVKNSDDSISSEDFDIALKYAEIATTINVVKVNKKRKVVRKSKDLKKSKFDTSSSSGNDKYKKLYHDESSDSSESDFAYIRNSLNSLEDKKIKNSGSSSSTPHRRNSNHRKVALSKKTYDDISDEDMSDSSSENNKSKSIVDIFIKKEKESVPINPPLPEEDEPVPEKIDSIEYLPLTSSESETELGNGLFLNDSPKKTLHIVQEKIKKIDATLAPKTILDKIKYYYPGIDGCRNVDAFEFLNRIEEGTYGVVYRAKSKCSNRIVALKRLKMEKEKEGFPITSLREVICLLKSKHENVVNVQEIVVGSNIDRIYVVMDYIEHDLRSLLKTMKEPFMISEVKTIFQQIVRGVNHLHDSWIIHRDLKTSNILLSHNGVVKLADFGLAREYGSPLLAYTPIVVTLWYRAPELLLGAKLYSTAIDVWSCGCILSEIITKKTMFPGKGELDQLNLIFKTLGTPNEKIWPGCKQLKGMKNYAFEKFPYNTLHTKYGTDLTILGLDLLDRTLCYDPKKRLTAQDILDHSYFEEHPLPIAREMFPTWPAKSELCVAPKSGFTTPKAPRGGRFDQEDSTSRSGFFLSSKRAPSTGFSLKF
ncbi:hypothetical protein A3Q56_02146 [Intoshia linei]|uniref:cyclin-dependent kinase n=1 Tax=Intoshia linei TaxID=1819745 RepID=A0A177B757_9BILA|nr:hypothetical protein A3Q56_02146 [Intoshia linei]